MYVHANKRTDKTEVEWRPPPGLSFAPRCVSKRCLIKELRMSYLTLRDGSGATVCVFMSFATSSGGPDVENGEL